MKFKFLSHTADVQFEAYGKTLEEVFTNSALALTKSICDEKIKEVEEIKINIEGSDLENLLYNFLEELLILFDSEYFILSHIKKIEIDEKNLKLKAEILGDYAENYEMYSNIKAVTYNEMEVKETAEGWMAFVTLDV